MPKTEIKNPALQTKINLDQAVMAMKTEEECHKLLREEQAGRNRYAFIMRIHSRLNHLRRAREREELARKAPKR